MGWRSVADMNVLAHLIPGRTQGGALHGPPAQTTQKPVPARYQDRANEQSVERDSHDQRNPSWRSEPNGLLRNEAKLHAVIAAAEVISPPVFAIAWVIPGRRPTRRVPRGLDP